MSLVNVFTNHILGENTFQESYMGWAKYKIMVLKPTNMYQIICMKIFWSMISNIIHFFIKQTFCEHLFYGTKNNKLQRQDNHSNIHLIINLLWH